MKDDILVSAAKQYKFFSPSVFAMQTLSIPHIQMHAKDAFVQITPGVLENILEMLSKDDTPGLAKVLHRLKSSVGMFCIESLRGEIAVLEKEALVMDKERFTTRTKQLVLDVRALISEVEGVQL